MEEQAADTEALQSAIIPTGNSSLDLELHWQDLLDIMEPQVTVGVEC